MGGACSRRAYQRQSSAGSAAGDRSDAGAGLAGAAYVAQPQGVPGLRDGFVGPTNSSANAHVRSFRVWSAARGIVENLNEGGAAGAGGIHAGAGLVRRSGRIDAAWAATSAGSTPHGAPATDLHTKCSEQRQACGPQCPALSASPAGARLSLQERCLARLCVQLRSMGESELRAALGGLTKDLTQRLVDRCTEAQALSVTLLRCLGTSTLEAVTLGGCAGVSDKWLLALRAQAETLMDVDVSHCTSLTDVGLLQLLNANRLRTLYIDMCLQVTDDALLVLQDCDDLRSLSCRGCSRITGDGLSNLEGLTALTALDLERCPHVHGGLHHLSGLARLCMLNLGWCNDVDDADLGALAGLTQLEELSLARTKVTDDGMRCLQSLTCMKRLSILGCHVSDECFASLSHLTGLTELNADWCADVTDAALVHLRQLPRLKVLMLAYTAFGDGHASMFSELRALEELSLDSCSVSDATLGSVAEIKGLRTLDLSDTAVTNDGLHHLQSMTSLESLNLSFSSVSDSGLRFVSGLQRLRSLNIDSRLITDQALAYLSTLTGLRSLDVFGAKITDAGLAHLRGLKLLESLEVCGGGISDAGMRQLASLTALMSLNVSQNSRISDAGLAPLASMTALQSLNLSGCKVSSAGLVHLRGLPCLETLALHNCRVTRSALNRTLSSALCLWPRDLVVSGIK